MPLLFQDVEIPTIVLRAYKQDRLTRSTLFICCFVLLLQSSSIPRANSCNRYTYVDCHRFKCTVVIYLCISPIVGYLQSYAAGIWSTEDMEDKLADARRIILAGFDNATKVMGALAISGAIFLLPMCREISRALAVCTVLLTNNTTHCSKTGVIEFGPTSIVGSRESMDADCVFMKCCGVPVNCRGCVSRLCLCEERWLRWNRSVFEDHL